MRNVVLCGPGALRYADRMHPVLPTTGFDVVELRRYAMRPGARDTLIDLFEREFIETQEACGMVALGHYRDRDDANGFVWLRGFPTFESRRDALAAFYTSQTWLAHRDAANATMVDSDNVLLLRAARANSGFDMRGLSRSGGAERDGAAASQVAVSVLMLDGRADETLIGAFESDVLPQLRAHARRVAYLVTEERANDFPRLPVRDGEHAVVVAGVCPHANALDAWTSAFEAHRLGGALRPRVTSLETLRLEPAARSLFR